MGGYPPGIPHDAFWKTIVSRIRQAADYGAGRHVVLAVDGIWPVWVDNSPDTLDRLFHDVGSPNFGVNFDPSYLALMDVDPAGFVKRFARRIVHAHLKDHVGKYPKWTDLIPGRGAMDYAAVFAALDRIKFAGSCAAECFTTMKFEEACDESFRALTAAARKAGVRFRIQPARRWRGPLNRSRLCAAGGSLTGPETQTCPPTTTKRNPT